MLNSFRKESSGNKLPALFEALTTKDLLTENGMPTHSSSGSFVVDLFYEMGGFRNGRKPTRDLIGLFFAAYGENPNLAVKALLNLRDIRGGMGERESFRVLLHFLARTHPEVAVKLVRHIPEYGRWDDLLVLLSTPVENEVLTFILESLRKGDELCAKWMPRENKSKGEYAIYLAQRFGMSAQRYRKMLAGLSKGLVERKMCQGMWHLIKFEHVPSKAMAKYRRAFGKHEQERFAEYLTAVEKGEAKIHSGAMNPVDIVLPILDSYSEDRVLEAQWKALPDVVPADLSFLPICDLSGSMLSPKGIPMAVSIALGIYLSQRNKSIFKDAFITFSERPTFVRLTEDSLLGNLRIMRRSAIVANTNLEAVFSLILTSAVRAGLSPEDMPKNLMIISDMQFDSCVARISDTALEMINRMYRDAGYKRPGIFFWNVATAGGIPAKIDDSGVSLISGYSPNLLRSVLTGDFNPLTQVMAILNVERYSFVDSIL